MNLAFGSRVTLLEVIAELEAVLGHPLEREHLAHPRRRRARHPGRPGARFRSLFPDVEPVPLAEGLRRTVDWFRGQPAS